eukprot:TRINITY_DN80102_c0_g1_i1.p1 TRINITY_DN80102_c0_g1~~TRINITY_DN80102_c0_g1_i1.p1  ORF type:complete len:538 (-),score=91.94 TRINITY_DN80102_c0_g1_i1:86-1699(-)
MSAQALAGKATSSPKLVPLASTLDRSGRNQLSTGPSPASQQDGSENQDGSDRKEIRSMVSTLSEESIDYGRPGFDERRSLGPQPLRVRIREVLCGSSHAFFTLFGWRFLRRSMMGIWHSLLSYTGLAIMFVGLMNAAPDAKRQSIDKAVAGFGVLFDFTRVFLVFTLTAVVGTMYGRWWEMRKLAGGVMGSIQDATILVATYISGEDAVDLKCDLVRYLNLALALMFVQARGKHGSKALFSLASLQSMGLVTEEEHQVLVTHEGISTLHAVACMWFLQLWLECVREGVVAKEVALPVHRAVQEHIATLRGSGAAVFAYQSTPPPIGYFRVLYMLLNISLLIAPFGIYANLVERDVPVRHRWMVVPVVFVITFFLLSFIRMCYEMFDPFSDGGGSHFPLKHYLVSSWRSTFALLEMPRAGRLRYYHNVARRSSFPSEASESELPTKPSMEVIEEEEGRLNRMIKQNRIFSDDTLTAALVSDAVETRAVSDMEEGQCLLGSRPSASALFGWPGDMAEDEEIPVSSFSRLTSVSSSSLRQ